MFVDCRYAEDEGYQRINGFLERIPQDVLATASYNCQAYTRALMHYEQFLKQKDQNVHIHDQLDFLQVSMGTIWVPAG